MHIYRWFTHTIYNFISDICEYVYKKDKRKERDILFVCGILELVFHSPKLFSKLWSAASLVERVLLNINGCNTRNLAPVAKSIMKRQKHTPTVWSCSVLSVVFWSPECFAGQFHQGCRISTTHVVILTSYLLRKVVILLSFWITRLKLVIA